MSVPAVHLLTIARQWLGTPWHHQAALKGIGCDCAGYVMGATAEALVPAGVRALADMKAGGASYPRLPRDNELLELCDRYMTRIPRGERRPADVLVFRYHEGAPGELSQHMGFLAFPDAHGCEMFMHAHAPARKTVETIFAEPWCSRLAIVYRIPGVGP